MQYLINLINNHDDDVNSNSTVYAGLNSNILLTDNINFNIYISRDIFFSMLYVLNACLH